MHTRDGIEITEIDPTTSYVGTADFRGYGPSNILETLSERGAKISKMEERFAAAKARKTDPKPPVRGCVHCFSHGDNCGNHEAPEGESLTVVELAHSSRYDAEQYGVLYRSRFVHRIRKAKHNRNAEFVLTVWDNTSRINTCPEGKWTDFGRYGGPGKYLGPDNVGTDAEISVTTRAQAVVIALHPVTRQAEGAALEVGQRVMLRTPEGALSGPYVIAEKALHDPHLEPAK